MFLGFSIITILFFVILFIFSMKKNYEGNLIYSSIFGVISIIFLTCGLLVVPVKQELIILDESEYLYETFIDNGKLNVEIEWKNKSFFTKSGVGYLEGDCEVILIREVSSFGIYINGDDDYILYIVPKEKLEKVNDKYKK